MYICINSYNDQGYTPFQYAVLKNQSPTVLRFLAIIGSDLFKLTNNGLTIEQLINQPFCECRNNRDVLLQTIAELK